MLLGLAAKCGYDTNTQSMTPIAEGCCPSCMDSESDNRPISISIVNSADTNSRNTNAQPQYQQPTQYQQRPVLVQQRPVLVQQRPIVVRQEARRPVMVQSIQPTRIMQLTRIVEKRVPVEVIKEVPKEVIRTEQVIKEVPYNPCKPRNYAAWY